MNWPVTSTISGHTSLNDCVSLWVRIHQSNSKHVVECFRAIYVLTVGRIKQHKLNRCPKYKTSVVYSLTSDSQLSVLVRMVKWLCGPRAGLG